MRGDVAVDRARRSRVQVGHAVGQQHDDLIGRGPSRSALADGLEVAARPNSSRLPCAVQAAVSSQACSVVQASIARVVIDRQRLHDRRRGIHAIEGDDRNPIALVRIADVLIAIGDRA